MNHKSLDTLVDDIYKAISPLSKGKPIKLSKKDLKEFGNDMTLALESWASPIERDTTNKNTLRMSNIGRKNKQLWYDLNFKKEEKELPPSLFIKFLYSNM